MAAEKKEVRRARELIARERSEVLASLGETGDKARKAGRRQAEWRREVQALLERGTTAGVSVTEMAKALGLSRQWTSHLAHAKTPSDPDKNIVAG